jgi:hypothetical protein
MAASWDQSGFDVPSLRQAALGAALLQKGRAPEAAAHFQGALELEPQSVMPLNNLAWLLATLAPTPPSGTAVGPSSWRKRRISLQEAKTRGFWTRSPRPMLKQANLTMQ